MSKIIDLLSDWIDSATTTVVQTVCRILLVSIITACVFTGILCLIANVLTLYPNQASEISLVLALTAFLALVYKCI